VKRLSWRVERRSHGGLPDPGEPCRIARVDWRLVGAAAELTDYLSTLDYATVERDPRVTASKRSARAFWARVELGSAAGGTLFVKGRALIHARRRLASVLHTGELRKEWCRTWWLRARGIETPEPLAVGEARRLRQLRHEYIVCRWIDDAHPLGPWLEERQRGLDAAAVEDLRRDVVRQVGELVGSLHAAGAYHRQPHSHNILVVESPGAPLRLVPIDCKHLSIPPRFDDDDWRFSVELLTWWLRAPVIDWSRDGGDLEVFARGYLDAWSDAAPDLDALTLRLRTVVPATPFAERPARPAPPSAGRSS